MLERLKMNISCENNNEIVVKMNNQSQEFKFSVENGSTDLTEFAKALSEYQSTVTSNPINYQSFLTANPDIDRLAAKLSDYIYKIIEAFNNSYNEVYNIENADDVPF